MAISVKVGFKNFDGVRGGVQFIKGVGIFEDEAVGRRIAAQMGYEIIEVAKEAPKGNEDEPKRNRRKKEDEA